MGIRDSSTHRADTREMDMHLAVPAWRLIYASQHEHYITLPYTIDPRCMTIRQSFAQSLCRPPLNRKQTSSKLLLSHATAIQKNCETVNKDLVSDTMAPCPVVSLQSLLQAGQRTSTC